MTLNEIPNFRGALPPQTPLGGLTAAPKPPAVCTKPLHGFVFPRYAQLHQFLGGSAAPAVLHSESSQASEVEFFWERS